MADLEENVKPNREETLDGSGDEGMNSDSNNGENDETVKTFKDLVIVAFYMKKRLCLSNINRHWRSRFSWLN